MNVEKLIVFDLDETLGYFTQIGIFYDIIQKFQKQPIHEKQFFKLLHLYPKIFRPNIMTILKNLSTIHKDNANFHVVLYTNNQGPKKWAREIINYIHYKIKYPLFYKIIGAYKVKNTLNEPLRTSHDKKFTDLQNIVPFSNTIPILFLDDQYHEEMDTNTIQYILLEPYTYYYSWDSIVDIFMNKYPKFNTTRFKEFVYTNVKQYTVPKYSIEEITRINNTNYIISQMIYKKIIFFFSEETENRSRKYKLHKKRKRYKEQRTQKKKRTNKRHTHKTKK